MKETQIKGDKLNEEKRKNPLKTNKGKKNDVKYGNQKNIESKKKFFVFFSECFFFPPKIYTIRIPQPWFSMPRFWACGLLRCPLFTRVSFLSQTFVTIQAKLCNCCLCRQEKWSVLWSVLAVGLRMSTVVWSVAPFSPWAIVPSFGQLVSFQFFSLIKM